MRNRKKSICKKCGEEFEWFWIEEHGCSEESIEEEYWEEKESEAEYWDSFEKDYDEHNEL